MQLNKIVHHSGIIGLILISQTAMVAAIFSIVVVSPTIINNFLLLVTIWNAVTIMNAITLIQNFKWFLFSIMAVSIVGFPYFIVKPHSNIETCGNTIHKKMQPYMDSFIQMLLSLIRTIINCFEHINRFCDDHKQPNPVIDNCWCNVDETNISSGKRPRMTRNYSEECFEEPEESEETEGSEESEGSEGSDEESEESEESEETFEERDFGGEQIRRLRIYNEKNDNETEDEYLNRLVEMAEEEDKKVLDEVLDKIKTQVETEVLEEVQTEVEIEDANKVSTEVQTEVETEDANKVSTEVQTEVEIEDANKVLTDSDEDAYNRAKEV